MKKYILNNIQPILVGVLLGMLFMIFKKVFESLMTKIAILSIKNK